MNFVVWTKLFIKWQTKDTNNDNKIKMIGKKTIIQQNKTAAIRTERFGKRLSTKRIRHLSIRYHYITSLLKEGFITVMTYMPIENTVLNYLIKPLQGSIFQKHQNCILGITEQEESDALRLYQSKVEDRTPT